MVFVYAIFVVNAYVSIKYEVETIDNDAIINMVYQIFDTGVTVNFIWFAINTIIILGLYIKFHSICLPFDRRFLSLSKGRDRLRVVRS